jgi:hypothetical protein
MVTRPKLMAPFQIGRGMAAVTLAARASTVPWAESHSNNRVHRARAIGCRPIAPLDVDHKDGGSETQIYRGVADAMAARVIRAVK